MRKSEEIIGKSWEFMGNHGKSIEKNQEIIGLGKLYKFTNLRKSQIGIILLGPHNLPRSENHGKI